MNWKKLLFLGTSLAASVWLYKAIKQQQLSVTEKQELNSTLQKVGRSLKAVNKNTHLLEQELVNSTFAADLEKSFTEYQFKIEPILKRLAALQQEFPKI
ncbi:hypothetical protein [Liquorilactobacillus vini]|uniref:Uncharacterized protein n=1 Tax=Liquorilactobacillus vini DSM 20605 TaxID=1133569 RepID=A0A0R2CES5_9LACO|nr:hypothetical protein [Liquorilactobacillus vini]KRM89760.1 hypothetical protein FD21_GL000055 [Liquorilactobacillus vini DSM 20605]